MWIGSIIKSPWEVRRFFYFKFHLRFDINNILVSFYFGLNYHPPLFRRLGYGQGCAPTPAPPTKRRKQNYHFTSVATNFTQQTPPPPPITDPKQ